MSLVTPHRVAYGTEDPDGFLTPPQPDRLPWLMVAFCLTLTLLPNYSRSPLPGPFQTPTRAMAWLMLLTVIVAFVGKRSQQQGMVNPGVVIILFYSLLHLIVWGMGVTHVSAPLIELLKNIILYRTFEVVGIALYALTTVRTPRQRRQLFGLLTFGITVSAVIGIFEQRANMDFRLLFQPPGFTSVQVDRGIGSAQVNPNEYNIRYGVKRVWGTATHPIEFSVLIAAFLPFALHFARFSERRLFRILATLSAIILLFALPSGVSRSGVVALVAASLVYVWAFTPRQVVNGLAIAAALVGAQVLLAPDAMQALWKALTIPDDSVLVRITRSTAISEAFKSSPIFGLGPAEVPKSLQLHGANGLVTSGAVDNQWFGALVSGGIVGFTGLLILFVGGFFGFAAARRAATCRRDKDLALAGGAVMAAIFTTSFTFDLFAFAQVTAIYLLTFGALWSAYSVPNGSSTGPSRRPDQRARHFSTKPTPLRTAADG